MCTEKESPLDPEEIVIDLDELGRYWDEKRKTKEYWLEHPDEYDRYMQRDDIGIPPWVDIDDLRAIDIEPEEE